MDRAGVFAHHIPEVDNIKDAMANPPPVGRARLRGEYFRRLAGHNGRCLCDWQSVHDRHARTLLGLINPFETEAHWRNLPKEKADKAGSTQRGQRLSAILRDVAQRFSLHGN